MSYPISAWFSAYVFTQVVEVPVYVLAMRRALRSGHAERPQALTWQIVAALGASAITHPMVWYLIPNVFDPRRDYIAYFVAAEGFAVIVEAFYFYSLHIVWLRRAFVWSLIANASSVVLGLLSRALFGWP